MLSTLLSLSTPAPCLSLPASVSLSLCISQPLYLSLCMPQLFCLSASVSQSLYLCISVSLYLSVSVSLSLSASQSLSLSASDARGRKYVLTHTLIITCTCCVDLTKGAQDKDFSYSFFDSLSQPLCLSASVSLSLSVSQPLYLSVSQPLYDSLRAQVRVFRGHTGSVLDLCCVLSGGKEGFENAGILCTVSEDGSLRLWRTGEPCVSLLARAYVSVCDCLAVCLCVCVSVPVTLQLAELALSHYTTLSHRSYTALHSHGALLSHTALTVHFTFTPFLHCSHCALCSHSVLCRPRGRGRRQVRWTSSRLRCCNEVG